MKTILIILLALVSSSIMGVTCWDTPATLLDYHQADLNNAITTSNGNTLIAWSRDIDGYNYSYIQMYDQDMASLWPQPLMFTTHPGGYVLRASLCESSDSNFYYVCAEGGYHDRYYAYKFNANGQSLWSSDGIYVSIISFYNVFEVKTYPRNDGGVLISITCDGLYQCFFVLQALTPTGEQIAGINGLQPEPVATTSKPQILLLDNDDFILCYITNQTAKMRRYNANLTHVWSQTTASGSHNVPQGISKLDQTSFMYVFASENNDIKGVRMSFSGDFLSPPWTITTGSGFIRFINLTRTSNSEVLLCWGVNLAGSIILMKYDFSCNSLWDQPVIIPTEIYVERSVALPDSNGGAYYVFEDWGNRTKAIRVDAAGSAVWQDNAIQVFPEYVHMAWNFVIPSGNGFMFVVEATTVGQLYAGIYCQRVSQEGELTWPGTGYLIMEDVTVTVSGQSIFGLGDRALVSFSLQPQNTQDRYHYYQIVNPDGSLLFAKPGIQFGLSRVAASIWMYPAAEGNCLLLWIEQNSQVSVSFLKAQLIDQQGNQLWEPGGRLLISASNFQSVSCSYQNGYHYIVWSHHSTSNTLRIYGQKYLNGVPQWPEDEKQLSFDHNLYPEGNHQNVMIRGRYLIWFNTASKVFYASCINEDGSIVDSYTNQGIQIATLPAPYQTQSKVNAYEWNANLFVSLTSVYTYYIGEYEFVEELHNAKLFTPTAEQLWGQQGSYWNPEMLYCFFDDKFIGILGNRIICRNAQSQTLWQNDLPTGNYTFPRLYKNSENEMTVITYRNGSYNTASLLHYYVTTTGQIIIPLDSTIFDNINIGVYSAAPGKFYTYVFRDPGIVMQKITSLSTDIQDQELSPEAVFSVSSAYPNPFSNKVSWVLDMKINVSPTIDIYNLKGQKLRSLNYGHLEKGQTVIDWDGLDSKGHSCASGVYIVKISSASYTVNKRIVKLK